MTLRPARAMLNFSLGHGALNEVYYPTMDHPCTRDMALVITDGRGFPRTSGATPSTG